MQAWATSSQLKSAIPARPDICNIRRQGDRAVHSIDWVRLDGMLKAMMVKVGLLSKH